MTIDWWTLGLQTVNIVILVWEKYGDDGEGFPGFRGGPSALPPAFGGGRAPGGPPAAFSRRDKKKKRTKPRSLSSRPRCMLLRDSRDSV